MIVHKPKKGKGCTVEDMTVGDTFYPVLNGEQSDRLCLLVELRDGDRTKAVIDLQTGLELWPILKPDNWVVQATAHLVVE